MAQTSQPSQTGDSQKPPASSAPSLPGPPVPGELNTIRIKPLTVRQKFNYRVVEEFGLRGIIGNAIGASVGQALNTPGAWGQGPGGYALRYVSGVGETLTRQNIAWAIDSLDHTDPRYIPSRDLGLKERFLCAMKQTFWVKRDNGEDGFAYGRVVSAFATGQITNAWQPSHNNTVSDGIKRSLIMISVDAGENLAQEVFTFLRPKSVRDRSQQYAMP